MPDISRSTVSIRLFGAELDPEYLTQSLGCLPSFAAKKGEQLTKRNGKTRVVKKGFWRLHLNDGEDNTVPLEEKIELLLGRLTDNLDTWQEITKDLQVADIFCGLFIDNWNEGFGLSPAIMKKVSDRNIKIDFDIYSPTNSWYREKEQDESIDE